MKFQAKKVLSVFICTLVIAAIAFGVALAVIGAQKAIDVPTVDAPLDENLSGGDVTDGDGNKMDSGTVYPMSDMVFTVPSALSGTASGGVTISATITPDTATDKTVSWYAEFVNSASTWANGKAVAEYVTVTPTEDGALTATVACLQAFGEQVKIKVVSRDNPEATASCMVDFGQKVTGATLAFGDLNVPLGSSIDVKWELNKNGVGVGGLVSSTSVVNNVFTVSSDYIISVHCAPTIRIQCPSSNGGIGDIGYVIWRDYEFYEKSLYVDCSLFEQLSMYYDVTRTETYNFFNSTTEENISTFGKFVGSPYLSVWVVVTGTYGIYTSSVAKLNILGYTNQASVTGVAINNSTIVI